MAHVYLNGRIVPEAEALIPANDRAVLFGDGAYETMRSYSGKIFRVAEHLRRLRETLRGMDLDLPISDDEIAGGASDLLEAGNLADARLRLTVTGGLSDGSIRLTRSHAPNLIMSAAPLVPPPANAVRDGVPVILSPWRVHTDSPLPRIKTINRLMHLMAKEEAIRAGAWDALFCDETGNILEGTATNVFFVVEGTLRTPSLRGPLLAGVTRDAVIEAAGSAGVPVREGAVPAAEAREAGEVFLTSTTIELLPVTVLQGAPVGAGKPGPVWRALWKRYRETVGQELGLGPEFARD